MTENRFDVVGMTCAACQANVTKAVSKLDGVKSVDVNLLNSSMKVNFEENAVSTSDIINAVEAIGYGASVSGSEAKNENFKKRATDSEEKQMKQRLIYSAILLPILMYVAMGSMLGLPLPLFFENPLFSAFTQLLITLPILIINKKFFVSGFKALVKRVPNMDTLVAVGSGASLIYGIFAIYRLIYGYSYGYHEIIHQYAHSLYFESSGMILTLVTVGKYLETRSKAKTTRTIEKLINLAPKTATVIRNGNEFVVRAEDIIVGDTVVIRPGDTIPVDGVIISGNGFVDQSAITGESIAVEKQAGDSVISATINKNGSFNFKATKVGSNTTLAQIIHLVNEAGSSKAPIARLADKISGIFVPVVIVISAITAVAWLGVGKDFEFALNCAISVLVISCPCALGLATPVAVMVGTGKAAEMGILIKSAESLEMLHKVDTVVFDKTGTLTSGKPAVKDVIVICSRLNKDEFIHIASSLEAKSEHPIAHAILSIGQSNNTPLSETERFEAVPGRGIKAQMNGSEYLAGNIALLKENGINATNEVKSITDKIAKEGKTPLVFAENNEIIGIISVADTVRDCGKEAITELHKMGIKTVLLTGDNCSTAKSIGEELGIKKIISDVLPTEKDSCIAELQKQGLTVAMVGDGINDAPALTRADVGIAIGAGTDIAVESADIVLIKNSPSDVVTAIRLSKAVIKNIKVNLFWAFFYNALGIPLAAGIFYPVAGILLSPMIGSFAMSCSSLCVVTNALRLRFFKDKNKEENIIQTKKGEMKMKKILKIEGMMCPRCQAHVQKALEAVEGVESVEVSLENKSATVALKTETSNETLTKAVTDAGYDVIDCE